MPTVEFGNLGTTWDSMESLVRSKKILGNALADEINFESFMASPLTYIDELHSRITVPIETWELHLLNALQLQLIQWRLAQSEMDFIPSLNDPAMSTVRNGQVVSFRCMIQSILDSEFVPHEIPVKDRESGTKRRKPALLRDVSKEIVEFEDENVSFFENEVFMAITPPGENAWVAKRGDGTESETLASECKRMKLNDGDSLVELPNCKEIVPYMFINAGGAKRMACLVKMLRESNKDDIKPNDLVEITGLVYADNDQETDGNAEDRSPPLSGIHRLPVIHVFACSKLVNGHPKLPLIEGKLLPFMKTAVGSFMDNAHLLRDLISMSLAGDRYATVFVMAALAARVSKRNPSPQFEGPIGKFAINVCGVPEKSEILDHFEHVIRNLVLRTLTLNASIDTLQSWKLTPKLDMESEPNILHPELLQIPHGTVVVLNETNIAPGELNQYGMENVNVINELIVEQQVKYNYTYQFPIIPTHAPFISMSTSPSLFCHDLRVKLNPDTKLSAGERRCRIDQLLQAHGNELRNYLNFVRCMDLTDSELFVDESIQRDMEAFYATRNQSPGFKTKMSPLEFSGFITSCRMWCLLHGSLSITRDGFNFWKEIELIRDSRVAPPQL